ncbi:hypothetical protein V7S43_013833 [Phytophthora oleae]|uniref:Uncharacterized protein n=1 Tax=Phytophthora oleae TaxID=2107226 RepID=A0ABD3F6U8_9STRA
MSKKNQLTSPIRLRDFHRFLVLLLTLVGFTLVLETFSLLEVSKDGNALPFSINFPWHRNESAVLKDKNPNEVSDEDLQHLSLLHEHCVMNANATLSWEFGSPGHQFANGTANNLEVVIRRDDRDLLDKLRQCPDVDIFLPEDLHGNGYCEDAVAYAKYLNSRLLSKWVLETKIFNSNLGYEVDYFDL